jgi:hypothetical protein
MKDVSDRIYRRTPEDMQWVGKEAAGSMMQESGNQSDILCLASHRQVSEAGMISVMVRQGRTRLEKRLQQLRPSEGVGLWGRTLHLRVPFGRSLRQQGCRLDQRSQSQPVGGSVKHKLVHPVKPESIARI